MILVEPHYNDFRLMCDEHGKISETHHSNMISEHIQVHRRKTGCTAVAYIIKHDATTKYKNEEWILYRDVDGSDKEFVDYGMKRSEILKKAKLNLTSLSASVQTRLPI